MTEIGNNLLEQHARDKLIEIAKMHLFYYVVWYSHFSIWFLIFNNDKRRKNPNVYGAMYEALSDVIENDEELFRCKISNNEYFEDESGAFYWSDMLQIVDSFIPMSIIR